MGRSPNTEGRLRVLTLARDAGSGFGGAEKVAYEFARRLNSNRFRSYLCTTSAPHQTQLASVARDREQLRRDGITVLDLNHRSFADLPAWRHLYGLMRRERIDILHAHMPRASAPGAILARLARVPVVISHEHGSALDGKIARRLLDRFVVAELSTRMLAVSEWDRSNIVALERIPAEKIEVLPNGIPPLPPPSGKDIRAELGVSPAQPLVGLVGRLFPEKGIEELVRAVALLRDRSLDVRCIVVGMGPSEDSLRELISSLGVSAEVQLVGHREDVPDLLRALDVAVLCSRREGSPLAILEYMAAGAPIVATEVGGLPELIEDGVHGLLVAPEDPRALADAIERLLRDRELATRLGENGRARQHQHHDLDGVVRQLERLYTDLYAQAIRA